LIVAFFALTTALAWTLWLVSRSLPQPLAGIVFLAGVFAPGIVALALTYRATGRNGVAALLRRLVDWEHPLRWYVFAASFMLVVKLTAAVLHRVAFGAWPAFGDSPIYLMLAATFLSTIIGGQAGEELGWRGFALPRLATRFGLGGASIVLGIVWAAWHLPFFLIEFPGSDTLGESFPLYLLQVIAISVTMAWLWSNTRGSLLPVMLLHAAINNTKDIVPSGDSGATDPWALSHSREAWLTVLLLWLMAGYCLVKMRRLRLPAAVLLLMVVVPRVAAAGPTIDWWSDALVSPDGAVVEGLAVHTIDKTWVAAAALRADLFPVESRRPTVSAGGFSVSADLDRDAAPEKVVVGVYRDCSGATGRFLLILKSAGTHWKKKAVFTLPGEAGLSLVSIAEGGLVWASCVECDTACGVNTSSRTWTLECDSCCDD
jgi:membrane protease YdiL (CAAX protease family)